MKDLPMGIKCSLFGHDHADHDVERERADHGEEVVTTVRTTEVCRRCGHERVISENTEITAAAGRSGDGRGTNGRHANGHHTDERDSDVRNGDIHSGDRNDRVTPQGTGRHAGSGDPNRSAERSPRSGNAEFEFGENEPGADRVGGAGEASDPIGPTAARATSRSLATGELWCPNCGFAEPALGSALRAGDSCPVCGRGYLATRTRKG